MATTNTFTGSSTGAMTPTPTATTDTPPSQVARVTTPPPAPPATPKVAPPAPSSQPAPSSPATPVAATPAPAQPNGQLGTDPAYLAYMRAMGLTDTDSQAAAQQASAAVQAKLTGGLAALKLSDASAQLNAGSRLEASGMSNSTTGQFNLAQLGASEAMRQEALRQTAMQQEQQLATNLALAIQKGNVGAANAALTAEQNTLLANAAAGNYGVSPMSPAQAAASVGVGGVA